MADKSHAAFLGRDHFAGLNGIRCIAILAVVWHHAPHPDALPGMTRGFFGVDLFFVLSGFLIATLLLRERAAAGRISLKDFWMRRLLRLMPAYYALLFALLAAYLIVKPGDPGTQALASGFFIYALYLSNWFHPGAPNLDPTWSLATEEQFYIVWPLLLAFASPAVLVAVWAGALVLNQLLNFGVLDGAITMLTGSATHPEILDTTFTPILLGVGLAHLMHAPATFRFIQSAAGFRSAPAIYALALLAVINLPVADISGLPRLAMHILATLFIASVALQPGAFLTRALETKPIAFIGIVSYGMYLYHIFALHAARAIVGRLGLPEIPSTFLIGAALTIAVASASYYLLERPFLKLRRRFRPARHDAVAGMRGAPKAAKALGTP